MKFIYSTMNHYIHIIVLLLSTFTSLITADKVGYSHLTDFMSHRYKRTTTYQCPIDELNNIQSGQTSIADYSQPLDTLSGKYDDFPDDSVTCLRKCDGTPRICYYKFYVQAYSTMSLACGYCPLYKPDCYLPQCVTADGVLRGISTYNRMVPGPAIQVCEGDTVVVDVENDLPSESTTIHWHGIRQNGSQYYDGVPYVTQCPIPPGTTFRYQFRTEEPGTFFYHSHSGLQKVDGLSGPLIVREIPGKSHNFLYDEDKPSHIMFLQDWMHILARDRYPGFQRGPIPSRLPNSYLINGRGIYIGTNRSLSDIAAAVGTPFQPPVTTFNVTQGKSYRFRVISGTCIVCPVMFYIQGHRFTIVSGDGGREVIPTTVDRMALNSGERFDIIINATNPVGSYWIALVGIGECVGANQLAILKYDGGPDIPAANSDISAPGPLYFNPFNSFCNGSTPNDLCLSALRADQTEVPPALQRTAGEMRILIAFGFYTYTIQELFQSGTYEPYFFVVPTQSALRSTVNNISYTASSSPLISQYNDIPPDEFCQPNCTTRTDCRCLNVINIPLGTTVDVIISDTSPLVSYSPSHPFHLHGYNFYVLEQGVYNVSIDEGIQELYRRLDNGEVRNPTAPMKDTVSLPGGGYVIIRFVADNPGFWFMHCHFLYHLETGMANVFHVGEFSDLPPIPPGFPKCGNYIPPVTCRN